MRRSCGTPCTARREAHLLMPAPCTTTGGRRSGTSGTLQRWSRRARRRRRISKRERNAHQVGHPLTLLKSASVQHLHRLKGAAVLERHDVQHNIASHHEAFSEGRSIRTWALCVCSMCENSWHQWLSNGSVQDVGQPLAARDGLRTPLQCSDH